MRLGCFGFVFGVVLSFFSSGFWFRVCFWIAEFVVMVIMGQCGVCGEGRGMNCGSSCSGATARVAWVM